MPAKSKHSIEEQLNIILDAATDCIEATSLMDFTMSAISKQANLSMGSIYKHIQTKEDVLIALATRMFEELHKTFKVILAYPLTMPEKLLALLLLSPEKLYCYSFGMHLEKIIGNEAILNRASANWIEKMIAADEMLEKIYLDNMKAASLSGELNAPDEDQERYQEELLVGMWSMDVGYFQVSLQRYSRDRSKDKGPLPFPLPLDAPIISCAMRLLNSYPWQSPLNNESAVKACELLEKDGYR